MVLAAAIEKMILDGNPNLKKLPFGLYKKKNLTDISAYQTAIKRKDLQKRTQDSITILLGKKEK